MELIPYQDTGKEPQRVGADAEEESGTRLTGGQPSPQIRRESRTINQRLPKAAMGSSKVSSLVTAAAGVLQAVGLNPVSAPVKVQGMHCSA